MTTPRQTTITLEQASSSARSWYDGSVASVLSQLESAPHGLSSAQARHRLATYGRNELPSVPATPWWRILARQFASPLILVLAAAALLSLAIQHAADAAFIAFVLAMNAIIGGSMEWRAERSAEALRRLLHLRAFAVREGEITEIDAALLVPGDVVWLESGFRVPADARLLSAAGLQTDESLLTGESLAVSKDAAWEPSPSAATRTRSITLADQMNMVHAGTTVVRGRARAVVVTTGAASSIGRLAVDVLSAPPGRPPLLVRLDRLSRQIGIACVVAAVLVAVLGAVVHAHPAADMAIFGVALAVSVIPEGLPIAITVALAVASTRMARRGVIVRRLGAVEGLGSCTLVATDKTGTLTCNELTAKEIRLPSGRLIALTGEGFAPNGEARPRPEALDELDRADLDALVTISLLCNEADLHQRDTEWAWLGDPTDVALLSMAHKLGRGRAAELEAHPELNRIPFEPEHRFAATYHRFDSRTRVLVKGAPERIRAMCAPTDDSGSDERWAALARGMADSGLRVLAFADGPAGADVDPSAAPPSPGGLRFRGLVGMIDPLRPGAVEAVRVCSRAGIASCMITGDHPRTALAIARELEMAESAAEVLTGDAMEVISDAELRSAIAPVGNPDQRAPTPPAPRIRVFARVTPAQKLRIVDAACAAGHFVAVTGDGANDAPALRAANIGVAMGRGGTDVARDAADLVISDNNFATIVAGIEEGRVAYDNIRKVIYLLLSTNGAEVVAMVGALAVGLPLPLLPTQLLWLNLATEGAQVASLAIEPGEPDVLAHPPRPPRETVFNRLMIERIAIGSLVAGGVSLAAFWWMIHAGWPHDKARNTLLLLMVLLQIFELGNARSETRSGFVIPPWRNPALLAAALLAVLLQLMAMTWPPLQRILATGPVSAGGWIQCILLALTVFLAIEIHKCTWWLRHR